MSDDICGSSDGSRRLFRLYKVGRVNAEFSDVDARYLRRLGMAGPTTTARI